jgi:hypothetical protein
VIRRRPPRANERFAAVIKIAGKTRYLGRWTTAAEASLAHDRAALHFGVEHLVRDRSRARALGPASPGELQREARLAFRLLARSSRYWGVYARPNGRWHAYLFNGEAHFLGTYTDEVAAAIAVDRAARWAGHPFLNFPKKRVAPASPAELVDEVRATRKRERSSRYIGPVWKERHSRPWGFYLRFGEVHFGVEGYASEKDAAIARDRAALHLGLPPVNFPREARAAGAADPETLRREVTAVRKQTTSSRYRGVSFSKREAKWRAAIVVNWRRHRLGSFDDELDAALAYDEAVTRLGAEPSRLNFPRDAPTSRDRRRNAARRARSQDV